MGKCQEAEVGIFGAFEAQQGAQSGIINKEGVRKHRSGLWKGLGECDKNSGPYSKRNGEPLESSNHGRNKVYLALNRIILASVWNWTTGKQA